MNKDNDNGKQNSQEKHQDGSKQVDNEVADTSNKDNREHWVVLFELLCGNLVIGQVEEETKCQTHGYHATEHLMGVDDTDNDKNN